MNVAMKVYRIILIFIFFVNLAVGGWILFNPVVASAGTLWDMQEDTDKLAEPFGGATSVEVDPRLIVVNIIKIFLSFLGLIFTVLIIYAGVKWMTARGNEDDVKKAKATIRMAVIGMVIILLAYVITDLVYRYTIEAVSNTLYLR